MKNPHTIPKRKRIIHSGLYQDTILKLETHVRVRLTHAQAGMSRFKNSLELSTRLSLNLIYEDTRLRACVRASDARIGLQTTRSG